MAVVAAAAFRSAFPINSILSEAESLVIVGQLIVSWRSLAVVVVVVPLNYTRSWTCKSAVRYLTLFFIDRYFIR